MHGTLRIPRSVLLFLLLVRAVAFGQAPMRLAVISDAQSGNAGAYLSARLTEDPAITLVEREELEKIGGERALTAGQSAEIRRAGALLNADALLLLQFIPAAGPEAACVSLRVLSTLTGEIHLSERLLPDRLSESVDHLRPRLQRLLPHLRREQEGKIALVVRPLRSSLSGVRKDVEATATFYLVHELLRHPKLIILERNELETTQLERTLAPEPSVPYRLAVASLVGMIEQQAGTFRIRAELTRANSSPAPPLEGQGDTIAAAAQMLARQVVQTLAVSGPPLPFDAKVEAAQAREEAHWAWKWSLWDRAAAAAFAAQAFDPGDWSMKTLFATAQAMPAEQMFQIPRSDRLGNLQRLAGAVAFLAALPETDFTAGPPSLVQQSTDLLWLTARVVNRQANGQSLPPPQADLLKTIRASCRDLASRLEAVSTRRPELKTRKAEASLITATDDATRYRSLDFVRLTTGGGWHETASENLAEVARGLQAFQGRSGYEREVIFAGVVGRSRTAFGPLIVDWQTSPAQSVPCALPAAAGAKDALLTVLLRLESVIGGARGNSDDRPIDPAALEAALQQGHDLVKAHGGAFTDGTIPRQDAVTFIAMLRDFYTNRTLWERHKLQSQLTHGDFLAALSTPLFATCSSPRLEYYNLLHRPDAYRPEQAAALAALLRQNGQRPPGATLRGRLQVMAGELEARAQGAASSSPTPSMAAASPTALSPTRTFFRAMARESGYPRFPISARWNRGRLITLWRVSADQTYVRISKSNQGWIARSVAPLRMTKLRD